MTSRSRQLEARGLARNRRLRERREDYWSLGVSLLSSSRSSRIERYAHCLLVNSDSRSDLSDRVSRVRWVPSVYLEGGCGSVPERRLSGVVCSTGAVVTLSSMLQLRPSGGKPGLAEKHDLCWVRVNFDHSAWHFWKRGRKIDASTTMKPWLYRMPWYLIQALCTVCRPLRSKPLYFQCARR